MTIRESKSSVSSSLKSTSEAEGRAGASPGASPLETYMTTRDPVTRDAAFLQTYAERIRNGTAATWEIPSTVAGTLDAIAKRMLAGASPGDGPPPPSKTKADP
jgi:hypothetical protein